MPMIRTARIWVSRLSMNQPVWNSAWCMALAVPGRCCSSQKVTRSNAELTAARQAMNRVGSRADQRWGWASLFGVGMV